MSDPLREAQKELDEIDLLVAGGSAIESMLHDDTSTDGDNDGVDAENIAAGLKDVELEANRAHQCADHDLNLIACYLAKLDGVKPLLRQVDVVVAAISRSTRLQTTFKNYCKMLDLTHKNLVKRAPTRWGSMEEQLTRFVEYQDVLLLMQVEGCFDKCATPVIVPTRAALPIFVELIDRLRLPKIVGRLLEARNVFTLPHLTYIVYRLVDDCKTAIAAIDPQLTPMLIVTIRHKMLEFVMQRLGKHLTDPTQPSLICALLMPEYSYRLSSEFLISDDILSEVLSNIQTWITDLANVAEVQPVVPSAVPRSRLFQNNNNNNVDNSIRRQSDLLLSLGESMSTDDHLKQFPIVLESLTVDSMRESNRKFATFFLDDKWDRLRPLIKVLFSASGSSASAEQAFSSSGRIDAPLRNQMHPATLEKLTVIQQYLARPRPTSLQQFMETCITSLTPDID